ncbi:ATP-binding cassette domain-containing protein [Kitasatospora azatica]|uniref:ATP-binding cassette domain-containing protein n=1 Tax=Kitasatospora azatica TaxID=58347 RepID=UPI00068ECFD6|nr:ABC transporter ATP-binding protein [Kitasatospora azatica]
MPFTEIETEDPAEREELKFQAPGDNRAVVARGMTTGAMLRRLPQLMRRALALGWQVDRASLGALLGCQLLSGLLGAFGLLATTRTLTALIAGGHLADRLREAVPSLLVLAVAAGARAVLGIAVSSLSQRIGPKISRQAELLLLDAGTNAELAAYDHPGFNDRWDAADRGADQARDLLPQTQNLIAAALQLAAAALVLTVLHPLLLPLLLVGAVPRALASVRAARITYLAMLATFEDRRLLSMLRWNLMDKQVADQVRSDTLADYLLGRYRAAGARIDRTSDAAAWRSARVSLAGAALAGLGAGVLWLALGWLLATGRLSVASAGTAVIAVSSSSQAVQGIVGYGTDLYRTGLYLDDWSTFVDEAAGRRLARGAVKPGPPAVVELREVTFRYPGAEAPIIDKLSLTVRRGEIVAIVGENGAGKSTLMKLLCGLNLATEGQVLWDGVDMRELDPREVWRHTAVVPQKFAEWPDTARENIQLGQPTAGGDADVLTAARASGAHEVIDRLRSGLNTLLAREWWGGVALSGGQWQRIAIGRAFFRAGGLLVLDEPTSDLDPRAEHRIFSGLRQVAADRAVVLVTHNLANTAVADRIVVLGHGEILQQGPFEQLTEEPGLFRELWLLSQDRSAIPRQRTEG